jgi:hypothetical protein
LNSLEQINFEQYFYGLFFIFLVPKNDIEWIVTSNGILKTSWLKKIADYKENDKVQMQYGLNGSNETLKMDGTATETIVDELKFGETYQITLIDKVTGVQSESFLIQACK